MYSKWVERAARPSRLATRQPEWPGAPGFSNASLRSVQRVAGRHKPVACATQNHFENTPWKFTMNPVNAHILTLNGGSSSIKFALFAESILCNEAFTEPLTASA